MLKRTRLNKFDTCLTYVLKRKGIDSKITFAKDLRKEHFSDYKENLVEIGSVVVWKHEKQTHLFATEIMTINSRPALFENHEFTGLHFGIVENIEVLNGEKIITISDCVRNMNNHSFPTITTATITNRDSPKSTEVRTPNYLLNCKKLEK